ncbi:hypothetical protein HYC85_027677 [Camellia sinensis]|uniref:Uncharacterized protein n=1 Tax=Camellia sinensis TaxID=4442 RepID=A0A7J7FWZ7_CAMSI|nr:hypothetical protein HYC85_027677 [Camellia sinensis]
MHSPTVIKLTHKSKTTKVYEFSQQIRKCQIGTGNKGQATLKGCPSQNSVE